MRVGSLFSGIGGIEHGLETAGGFETKWFVENDQHAQAVLRKNYPKATIYGDITQLDFKTVQPIDVLTGGFPCQDISNAGKRAGITGSRSSLWKYYAEGIRILRPKYIIAENVSALISRGLDVVLADLAALGYDAEWHCIPASSVGAPHRRDRIFIIAYPNNGREQEGTIQSGRQFSPQSFDELAHPNRSGCVHGQAQEQPDKGRQHAFSDSREGCADVANTDYARLQSGSKRYEAAREFSGRNKPSERGSGNWNWAVEPDVGRVAHGVPARVDRIKRLGNAVVPQVAQIIGEAINKR